MWPERRSRFESLTILVLDVVDNGDGTSEWDFSDDVTLTGSNVIGLQVSPNGSLWFDSDGFTTTQIGPSSLNVPSACPAGTMEFWQLQCPISGVLQDGVLTCPQSGGTS